MASETGSRQLMPDLGPLQRALTTQESGALTTETQQDVVQALRLIWDDLPGATQTKMSSHKLERGHQWTWSPPILTFSILRHPTAAAGGTRDENQLWLVNVQDGLVRFDRPVLSKAAQ
jgi:hypothetical protein